MLNYTKGKWEALDTGHVVVGRGFSMKVIANCSSQPEAGVGSRLIASAPDLYEACKSMRDFMANHRAYEFGGSSEILGNINKVLAKIQDAENNADTARS